jgi:hypothetical protein
VKTQRLRVDELDSNRKVLLGHLAEAKENVSRLKAALQQEKSRREDSENRLAKETEARERAEQRYLREKANATALAAAAMGTPYLLRCSLSFAASLPERERMRAHVRVLLRLPPAGCLVSVAIFSRLCRCWQHSFLHPCHCVSLLTAAACSDSACIVRVGRTECVELTAVQSWCRPISVWRWWTTCPAPRLERECFRRPCARNGTDDVPWHWQLRAAGGHQ